jgi:hypothetical protein
VARSSHATRLQRSLPVATCTGCLQPALTDPCFYCEELQAARARRTARYPVADIPTLLVRTLYRMVSEKMWDGYSTWLELTRVSVDTPGEAELVSSEIGNGMHAPVLDIDFHAALVPSSTRDHFHLYLDIPLTWRQYKRLLRALARAGIIEDQYARMSIKRRHSSVRVPWLHKPTTTA